MRILVTDDDRIAALTLKRMLEKLGHEVEVASDGLVAQRLLGAGSKFDLVLTDWMMPGLDGIELTRWIRKECGDALKVVIITGLDSGDASQYALRCGADGFLRKPVRQEELARRLALMEGDDPFLDDLKPEPTAQPEIATSQARQARHCLLVTTSLGQARLARELAEAFGREPLPGACLLLMGQEAPGLPLVGGPLEEGQVYALPAGQAVELSAEGEVSLVEDPRPWERSHRSLARFFRRGCQAIILDGGISDWDAYMGASYVVAARGHVLLQDTRQPQLQVLYDNLFSTGVPVELLAEEAILTTSRQIARYVDDLATV